MVEFGREVLIDRMALVLRADFLHDTTVSGIASRPTAAGPFPLQKTGSRSPWTWPSPGQLIRLEQLLKSDDLSIYPR